MIPQKFYQVNDYTFIFIQKSLRQVHRLSNGLFACQRKGYSEEKPKKPSFGSFGNLRLEPEFTGNMPDDEKTPFTAINKLLNFIEADFSLSSMRNYARHMINLEEIKSQT